jgi:oligopeptide/dipeptide ABC transporter ATP-binding protein
MYLGRIVEIAPSNLLYESPLHPYSQSLLAAIPVPDPDKKIQRIVRGEIPNPDNPPPGCHFHPRCPQKMDVCRHEAPQLEKVAEDRFIACHRRESL